MLTKSILFFFQSTIPHAFGTAQCNMKNLITFRKALTSSGLKVSVNDLLIKCVGNALALNPAVNCVWEGSEVGSSKKSNYTVLYRFFYWLKSLLL